VNGLAVQKYYYEVQPEESTCSNQCAA